MKIYKIEMPFWVNKPFEIEIDGEIINFEVQKNKIVCYYEHINENEPKINYQILMVETGYDIEIDSNSFYYNTLMLFDGEYVLHCYARKI